jgi:predicted nucleic acid-binding protein
MIVYLDASALVKRYVVEAGTTEVAALVRDATALGTAVISRAEVAAALGRAARMKLVPRERAVAALAALAEDWNDLIRLRLGEAIAARAAALAWDRGLRGYDAVHLAAALFWYETLDEPVTLATYDRELWRGAKASGLLPWPPAMP